jgi:hypothetical protein
VQHEINEQAKTLPVGAEEVRQLEAGLLGVRKARERNPHVYEPEIHHGW